MIRRAAQALMLLALLTACPRAWAALHVVRWTPPTQNTDGTPLTDLAGYQIIWGDCSGTKTPVGNAIGSLKLFDATLVSAKFSGPAVVCVVMYAFNKAGLASDATNVVKAGVLPAPGQPQPLPTPGQPTPLISR